ncbi:bacterial transcriptional activator domain-containing protein [Arthrobacter sp. zg-Y1219]|uniref:AfsR/SARP family transcriptional regulator n=1 Tax=Arthrobacter sp. zg-Y1219 TaxID=3049067 RepID=UPI0024C469F0|nr:bacterial transcriptional activator domain-containing protein [Arthrobacter sp. zg-Y1219]
MEILVLPAAAHVIEPNRVPMDYDENAELKLDVVRIWRLRRDGAVVHVASRQQRLITALAIRGPCLRSYLIGLLWPECPESKALESLRVSIHVASRQVPGLIVNDGRLLSISTRVEIDLHRVQAAIRALHDDQQDANASVYLRELRDAELLPGWYEDWVVSAQVRLTQDRLSAFLLFAERSLERGNPLLAEAAAAMAVEIEPLHENAVRLLLTAQMQQGNPAAALRAYERYRKQLESDFGIGPAASIKGLITDSLTGHGLRRTEHLPSNGAPWRQGSPTSPVTPA